MGREEAGRLDKEKENDGINAEAAERAECAEKKRQRIHISAAVPPGW
jgi:hypothetical protein